MPRVVHFEFNADDPEHAARFYGDVFGWRIEKWQGPADYWLASTGEGLGIDGAIQAPPEFTGGQRTVVTVGVESVDEVAAKVQAAGGTIVLPRMAVPHVGWLVYARDPAGMLFGVLEPDESARDGEAGAGGATGDDVAGSTGDDVAGGGRA